MSVILRLTSKLSGWNISCHVCGNVEDRIPLVGMLQPAPKPPEPPDNA